MSWGAWNPHRIDRLMHTIASSTRPSVVQTELGIAYVKLPDNAEGPHALARDLIGCSLAEELGLPTLDFSLMQITSPLTQLPLDADESKPIWERRLSSGGTAFLSRGVEGQTWNRSQEQIDTASNRETYAGLVVLDTWLANEDRHPRRPPRAGFQRQPNVDNVFLEVRRSEGEETLVLLAMDFSHCLWPKDGELRSSYDIGFVREEGVYGLFPQIQSLLSRESVASFLERLRWLAETRTTIESILARIPRDWSVSPAQARALADFLCDRGRFLADHLQDQLALAIASTSDPSGTQPIPSPPTST
jgi:hypothetical protein